MERMVNTVATKRRPAAGNPRTIVASGHGCVSVVRVTIVEDDV